MIRKIGIVLCLWVVASFAQKGVLPVAEIDSAAYYEEMYAYNYQKFRADESVADVLFWTSVGLGALTPFSAIFLGARSIGCNVNEDNDCGASALDVALVVPVLLLIPSLMAYGSFYLAKNIRRNKYNLYYKKREDYIKRKDFEKNGDEAQSVSVQILPLLNPVDGCYGVALAFEF